MSSRAQAWDRAMRTRGSARTGPRAFQTSTASTNCGTLRMLNRARNSRDASAAFLWSRLNLNSSSSPRSPAWYFVADTGITRNTISS